MCMLTQVPRHLCEWCKDFGRKLPKILALEQSYFALKAKAFKAYSFVQYTLDKTSDEVQIIGEPLHGADQHFGQAVGQGGGHGFAPGVQTGIGDEHGIVPGAPQPQP